VTNATVLMKRLFYAAFVARRSRDVISHLDPLIERIYPSLEHHL